MTAYCYRREVNSLVVALAWYYIPYTTSRFGHISQPARYDMNVAVKNALSARLIDVRTNVKPGYR